MISLVRSNKKGKVIQSAHLKLNATVIYTICRQLELFLQHRAFYWLLRGQITSNNITVSRQKSLSGKIAKSVTSECSPNITMIPRFICSHIASCNVFVALHNKSLNDWSLAKPVNIVSLESQYFLGSTSRKYCDYRKTKLPVLLGTSHFIKCFPALAASYLSCTSRHLRVPLVLLL